MPMYTVQGLVGRHAGVAGRGPGPQSLWGGREALLHDRWEAVRAARGRWSAWSDRRGWARRGCSRNLGPSGARPGAVVSRALSGVRPGHPVPAGA